MRRISYSVGVWLQRQPPSVAAARRTQLTARAPARIATLPRLRCPPARRPQEKYEDDVYEVSLSVQGVILYRRKTVREPPAEGVWDRSFRGG